MSARWPGLGASIALLVSACGLDGALFTPRSFAPTPPPEVALTGTASAGDRVVAYAADGRTLAEAEADAGGAFSFAIPADPPPGVVLVFAAGPGRATKALLVSPPSGAAVAVDARATAIAELALYEATVEAASELSSVPMVALAGLLAALAAVPELDALTAKIGEALARPTPGVALPFAPLQPGPTPEFLAEAGLPAGFAADYAALLAAAAARVRLEVRCDPTRLNVLFAVDASGQARDGAGALQLIRQPAKEGRLFLGFTSDDSSVIADPAIPKSLTPNDPTYAMTDDGRGGDEVAGDGVYSVVVALPVGARLIYKYTNGAAGEGFTRTEEWPGNARLLEVRDVLTGRPDGEPDCVVVRRDSFGDEATNKNFVNLHPVAKAKGGDVGFATDLGGPEVARGPSGLRLGGLERLDLRAQPGLTPAGVPEALENGVCARCPPPLTLDPNDAEPPRLVAAERTAVDRVWVRMSEPVRADLAAETRRYLLLDEGGRAVFVRAARPSGGEVVLEVDPVHPRLPMRLLVRSIVDVSARQNELVVGEIEVGPDRSAPRIVAARARALAEPADPTVGEVLELELDERPEESAAEDPSRYAIDGLEVLGAELLPGVAVVRLRTAPQAKGRPYTLAARGLRDLAGNALAQELGFTGFALHRVSFAVVPGYAYATSDGSARGLPRGERLYLTGTPLTVARDLAGRDVSVGRHGLGRSDVTGVPEFELVPTDERLEGEVVYRRTLLLPPGSYAWKAAHGVEGEFLRAPPTLEKVYKVLATTNDGTGVRIDPRTMRSAAGDDYAGARLSEGGEEPPRASVVYKREAPDEVCEVTRDVECPPIVIGAWRDLVVDQGGRTRDYDDGLPTLPPHRPTLGDLGPPALLDARARDSHSVLLSFDEALSVAPEVELSRASDGRGYPAVRVDGEGPRRHQVVVRIPEATGLSMGEGEVVIVRYRGAQDASDPPRVDREWRSANVVAPSPAVPFRPLLDAAPPRALSARATDLERIVVEFDEPLDPASLAGAFRLMDVERGSELAIRGVEALADRASVELVTDPQPILAPLRLEVRGVSDLADPPNVSGSAVVELVAFGEREAPTIARARAIGPTTVVLRYSEPMDATAADPTRYAIEGLPIVRVEHGADPARRALAFNPRRAPRLADVVVLTTAPMAARSYVLTARGVADRSGNAADLSVELIGVIAAPTVDVALEVEVSDAVRAAGTVPARALSARALFDSREGVFAVGARALDGAPVPGRDGPVNDVLGGFPPEGAPLDGIEARLLDGGAAGDRVAGDAVFTIVLPGVPLGTTIAWKTFAPFQTAFRDANPGRTEAAFADAIPGPAVFADGQEYPGNENAVVVLDEGAEAGVVRIRALFGDEVTYKKWSGGPAYTWAAGDFRPP